MTRFIYTGPVLRFGKIVNSNWSAITTASTPAKALNNLKFRAKKELNLEPYAKIELITKNLKIINKKNF